MASCARRHFDPLTAGSDRASLSDLTNCYLCLCIGLPYTLQLIIRASLIKYFYFIHKEALSLLCTIGEPYEVLAVQAEHAVIKK
jgi:hypothetical protein